MSENEEFIPALNVYTENYGYLYSIWKKTLPLGFEAMSHFMDLKYPSFEYRTDGWYACIKYKLRYILDTLINMPENKIVLCSDTDIMFLKRDRTLADYALNIFKDKPELEMLFMREQKLDMINGGFYFVRNTAKVRAYMEEVWNKCDDRELQLADQTYYNSTLKGRINYDYLPQEFVVWGRDIYDRNRALLHHAVCCKNIAEKIKQQNRIRVMFKMVIM